MKKMKLSLLRHFQIFGKSLDLIVTSIFPKFDICIAYLSYKNLTRICIFSGSTTWDAHLDILPNCV